MIHLFHQLVKEAIMKSVMKIVLILLGVIFILGIAVFLYVKSMLPNGGGNNDITEG